MGHRITGMWAYVQIDEDGDEGIVAVRMGDTWMPLVGSDRQRVDVLRAHAEAIARGTKQAVVLKRFALLEEVDVIEP